MGKPLTERFELGDEVVLRTFASADASSIFDTVRENFEHLHTFLHWAVEGYSREDVETFLDQSSKAIAERTGLALGIFDRENLIGSIGFVQFNWPSRRTEIGYWIDKRAEGRGIITRAVRLLTSYAFEELEMNRVEIHCAAENLRSRAVPERLGFSTDGIMRQQEWRHTRFYDMVIYSILRDEWRSQ